MSLNPSFSGGRRRYVFDPLSLNDWDSFSDFPFPSSCAVSLGRQTFAFASPRMYWKETQEADMFTVKIPGVKKEEVKVEIVKDVRILKISGERSVKKEELNGSSGHRVDRSSGKFTRRCGLSKLAEVDQAKASIKKDVLTITIPKAERKESDVVLVEITDET